MKKLLLLLFVLLTGVIGAWADEISWTSYPNGTFTAYAGFNWVGFKTPGTTSATFSISKISIALGSSGDGKTNSYAAISSTAPTTTGAVLNASDVLAISTGAIEPTANTSYEYTLNNTINLTGGTTYYIVFLSSNEVTDSKYTVTTQRVAVNTTYGTYAPHMGNVQNGSIYSEKSDWTPNIQATLTIASSSISYTLTDDNGASYTGTCTGYYGWKLLFEGCDNISLSDASWSKVEETFSVTANIEFPMPISSNSKNNYTYINCFENYATYPSNFLWRLDGTEDIKVQASNFPTNATGSNEKWEWSIIPTITNGNITFKIMNVSNSKYITSSESGNTNAKGKVTLTESGSNLTYVYESGNPAGYGWKLSTGKYLSSYSVDNDYYLSTWAHHGGTNVGFIEPADFSTLEANLTTAFNTASAELVFVENGVYTPLSGTTLGAAITTASNVANTIQGKNPSGGPYYASAATITAYTNGLNNAYSGLEINTPSAGFYRIKGYSNKYITKADASNKASMSDATDATTIIYINSDKNFIFYDGGLGLYNTCDVAPVGGTLNAYTFSRGNSFGFTIKSNANSGSYGQYCYDSNTSLNRNSSAITSTPYNTDWLVEEVTSLPVTISSVGYATLYSPVPLVIPNDVDVYVASDKGEYMQLNEVEGADIPANTGVILAGASGVYNFNITDSASPIENDLTGTVPAISRPANSYILSTSGGTNVGFYGDGSSEIPGFKAYLQAAGPSSPVKAFVFDDETAVKAIEAFMNPDKVIYDMNGRRVQNPAKGVYIVNGKKVIINK